MTSRAHGPRALRVSLTATAARRVPRRPPVSRRSRARRERYITGPGGIRPHADQGNLTVNCWITPDDANLYRADGGGGVADVGDSGDAAGGGGGPPPHGGLRIWQGVAPPEDLDFLSANRDYHAVRRWLREQQRKRRAARRRRRRDDGDGDDDARGDGDGDDDDDDGAEEDAEDDADGDGDDEGDDVTEIPYRANRCVIFRSELFHETAPFRFRAGLRNHRINLTFMYGVRDKGWRG